MVKNSIKLFYIFWLYCNFINYFIFINWFNELYNFLWFSFNLNIFLKHYLGSTIEITENTHLNWNIHNIAWNNKLLVILGFISSAIGLLLSFSIVINIVILHKNKLLSKFDLFSRISFSILFFLTSSTTLLAYNNSGIIVGINDNDFIVQGSKILDGQRKIISATNINWSYLNILDNKIEINNNLLEGNYVIFLSILIPIMSLSSILYIIYKIAFFKKNYFHKIIYGEKNNDNVKEQKVYKDNISK